MHRVSPALRGGSPSAVLHRPPWVDATIAVFFVALTAAEVLYGSAVASPARHLTATLPAMAALAWRRRFPVAVAVLLMAANIVANPEGQFSTLLALVLVAFTVGAESPPPRSYAGLAIMVVPFVIAMAIDSFVPSDAAAALVFLVGPWAVGTATQQRGRRAAEAVERADRLEREQDQQAAAAVEQERTRIARELHDIVSHSLSVITIQTQAVRRRLDAEHVREAEDLASVESTAREALADMRRLFGVLRANTEAASLTPQPGLAELARLLDQARSAGLVVDYRVEGEPYELQPGVDLAAYRILQEAITNSIRHSGADRVQIAVTYGPSQLHVEVSDNGRGMTDPMTASASGGHGLLGVRERVALYSGSVDVGPGVDGGVRLSATLPVRSAR